jgi:hypothetical protein
MRDETEQARQDEQAVLNAEPALTIAVAAATGPTWTTSSLCEAFDVVGFMAPFVVARRKSDGVLGSLQFTHSPRLYFGWRAD